MKVYREHNHDGVNQGLVAAKNLVEAAKALGTTPHGMRHMGWDHPPEDVSAVALSQPGVALYRPIDARDLAEYPWRQKPWHRLIRGHGWE